MSELVEKVRQAVRPHLYSEGGNSEVVARAAIAAVAKWLDEQPLETGSEPYDLAPARLFRELERLRGDK